MGLCNFCPLQFRARFSFVIATLSFLLWFLLFSFLSFYLSGSCLFRFSDFQYKRRRRQRPGFNNCQQYIHTIVGAIHEGSGRIFHTSITFDSFFSTDFFPSFCWNDVIWGRVIGIYTRSETVFTWSLDDPLPWNHLSLSVIGYIYDSELSVKSKPKKKKKIEKKIQSRCSKWVRVAGRRLDHSSIISSSYSGHFPGKVSSTWQ